MFFNTFIHSGIIQFSTWLVLVVIQHHTYVHYYISNYFLDQHIARVIWPTPRCSNALMRETPKEVRACNNLSQTTKKTIITPVFQIPTLNEHYISYAKLRFFLFVDLCEGFQYIPLHEGVLISKKKNFYFLNGGLS